MWFVRAISVCVGLLMLPFVFATVRAQQSPSNATITWGEDFDLRTLDPRVASTRHDIQVIYQIFEGLVFRDTDGKLYPWLAERWEYSTDGKSITFHLRKGVKFHDGTPFDGNAVKFTFDSIKDPSLGSQAAIDLLGPYQSTDVLDPYTVRVNWNVPFAAALTNMSSGYLGIVSPAAVKRLGNDGFARNPVGTGPFKFVEWVARERAVLERNSAYNWAPPFFKHTGAARFNRHVIRIIPDDSTRAAALEKREIDVADMLSPIDVGRFKASRDFDVMVGDVSGLPYSYFFNVSKAPTDDQRVRQAFVYAINRPNIVKQVFFGVAKPAFGAITASTPGYWSGAETAYPYNLDKARQLLDQAGWKAGPSGIRSKNGKSLELYLPTLLEPELAVAVQAAVKDAGVKLNVEKVTKSKQDELVIKNNYDVIDLRWVAVDPSILDVVFFSRNIATPGKFKFNFARFGSPDVDRMLAEADRAVDPARRSVILEKVQRLVLDRGVILPMHISPQPIGFRKCVSNLKFAPGYWHILFYDAVSSCN